MNIPEPIARIIVTIAKDAEAELFHLLEKVASSPDPKRAAAKAAQVLAHETATDAAIEAIWGAKKHIPGSGV